VTADELSFARDLYMSQDHLMLMQENNMYIGSHGYSHDRLDNMDEAEQRTEVDIALEFLKRVGARTDQWIMCYPYGGYNESLLSILSQSGCKIGLTTNVGIADLQQDSLLTLPRLDTNDLPKQSSAPANNWTMQIKETQPART
jgi:peptidoglycan/xylan/chitin deacetylase (PgdA/CDA1 family)